METTPIELNNDQSQPKYSKLKVIVIGILTALLIANSLFAFRTFFSLGGYEYNASTFFFKIFLYLIPTELGLLIGVLINPSSLKTILKVSVIASVMAYISILLVPYFIFFTGMFFPLIITSLMGLFGLCIGVAMSKYIKISSLKIFGIIIILSVSTNILAMNITINRANNCDGIADIEEMDACLIEKSIRNKDMSVCEKSSSVNEQSDCYIGYLFDFDYKNVHSPDQCNAIPNEVGKSYCYDFTAKATQNATVCQKIGDIKLSKKCMIETQRIICDKIAAPSKKSACEKILNELKLNQETGAKQQDMQTNNTSTGNTEQKIPTQRELDFDQITSVAMSMVSSAKKCDENGKIIKNSGLGAPPRFVCDDNTDKWPIMSVCGDVNDTQWIIAYKNKDWEYTLYCKNYPECNGTGNVKCTKDGCVFSEKCN